MAKTKQQKVEIVEKLEQALKSAASAVFVTFTHMNVADESAMRRGFHAEGINYLVAKKTLIRRALSNLGHAHEGLPLEGELAVAYSVGEGDASAPARILHGFAQKFKDKLFIAGGIFEGSLRDAVQMQTIATIPAMPVLRGMFAQVINSPRQRFAVVLSKVAETKQQ